ncbi:hypothetical protein LZ30DRAFT_115867 [Colletotrichum cereale]|nr:hypothetical protein LZ30DRAFT_115867 [Colletotrichum cereale]
MAPDEWCLTLSLQNHGLDEPVRCLAHLTLPLPKVDNTKILLSRFCSVPNLASEIPTYLDGKHLPVCVAIWPPYFLPPSNSPVYLGRSAASTGLLRHIALQTFHSIHLHTLPRYGYSPRTFSTLLLPCTVFQLLPATRLEYVKCWSLLRSRVSPPLFLPSDLHSVISSAHQLLTNGAF